MRDRRWWSLDDLRRADEVIFPEGFAELVAPILAGVLPAEPGRLA